MKKMIVCLLKIISQFISLLYPYSVANKLKLMRNRNYTYWLTAKFKNIGTSSIFVYPCTTIQGERYISIGRNVRFGARAILTAWDKYRDDTFIPQITIGDNINIGEDCHITAINQITIGNNVLMGKKVTISDNSHGMSDYKFFNIPPEDRPLYSKGAVIIEENVWLGDKVTVLAGVCIGENSVIGANSVVTKDIPKNCVAVGIPATVIKKL